MHISDLQEIMAGRRAGLRWPPPSESKRWDKAKEFRRRFECDPAVLFSQHRQDLHVPGDAEATLARQRMFTPVPILKDLARLSAQLLLSEPPEFTLAGYQEQLDALVKFNGLHRLLFRGAQHVASMGEGALRVIADDVTSDTYPVITYEPSDAVIWVMRHGRFVQSGIVVMEVEHSASEVYRLLEEHSPGRVRRRLFRGNLSRLGDAMPLTSGPAAFRDLRPDVRTGLSTPTLIRWLNKPSGESDGAGLERMMDGLDDAETVGRRKLRRSGPTVFVHRSLVDENRFVDLDGAIVVGSDTQTPLDEARQLVQHVQNEIGAADHVEYVRNLRASIITEAGYSLASYGLDEVGGQADSGEALKLRQHRSLLTRRQKEDEAVETFSQALGVAMAMALGASDAERFKPTVKLGTGIPEDEPAPQETKMGSLERRLKAIDGGIGLGG